ncbi:hypothetical protein KV697_09405 [Sphingomonas sanguinis]|uniref:hypothetical protein n=1 Tax=Sphingomonas sanguinis TaxID=33051 RepID=UPI001C591E4C|nr:hypothetical protein [Sphingomonas sanguinis]QXT37458.1 hypothetical protein KV697_09405 [Sphingomonas sanguinis]
MRSRPLAILNRNVTVLGDEPPSRRRIADYRSASAYVLLGEPGSGKTRAFELEALASGTEVVRARDFTAGDRPVGEIVFIDALEEYRIAEAGGDHLGKLISALAGAGYAQWRIACRAISLPQIDAERLARRVSFFETLQLEPLDRVEQRAILNVYGEAQPVDFIQRTMAIGADALLGNPSTLLLLHSTFARSKRPLQTRGALLDEATRQMAYASDELPDDPKRPSPAQIIAAAERAAIILLLSDRTDIWLLNSKPPGDHVVTRDDLVLSGVDIEALREALDTALFSGDGSSHTPTHRFVAEYLAGRALARATAPEDGRAALSLDRAIAFLQGDDDRPAPALTGIYAWFVITLSQTVHEARALVLVARDPAAILFHGDAAMMPTAHRGVLLDALGRDDPWFLGGNRGSTGIAGLAGSDLANEFKAILADPLELAHRRRLVLMTLAAGRPVPELADAVHAIFVDRHSTDFYDRRTASEAYARIKGETPALYREMLDGLADQNSVTALQLRVGLMAKCVPGATADEIRELLIAYAATGNGVMGYADPLGRALHDHPLPSLFDRSLVARRHSGNTRAHEIARVIDKALAAAIAATPDLSADRLIDWLHHAGIERYEQPEDAIRDAIVAWLDLADPHEVDLIEALRRRFGSSAAAIHEFKHLTGLRPSDDSARTLIALIDAQPSGPGRIAAAELAAWAIRPFPEDGILYWELWPAVARHADLHHILEQIDRCPLTIWEGGEGRRKRKASAEDVVRQEQDRRSFDDHLDQIRAGDEERLAYAALLYLGQTDVAAAGRGPDGLRSWLGDAAFAAVVEGWNALVAGATERAYTAGRRVARKRIALLAEIFVCWADCRERAGETITAPAVVLLTVAHYTFLLPTERAKPVGKAAIARFLRLAEAKATLLSFWKGAIVGRDTRLPLLQDLPRRTGPVGGALAQLLEKRPVLRDQLLGDTLDEAARHIDAARLLALAQTALSRTLPDFARRRWAFIAWTLGTPAPDLFDCDFSTAAEHRIFAELWQGNIGKLSKDGGASGIGRLEAIIARLGPLYPPSKEARRSGSGPSAMIERAIGRLAESPRREASEAFVRLLATAGLDAWSNDLAHKRMAQSKVRRHAAFQPPAPRAIAAALLAGPPATPGDLRAVVTECLVELTHDIRFAPTAPWKGFWNRPHGGKSTPKVENDCRDLLVDRLSDRLRRFMIPVQFSTTETRSGDDRRTDVLVTSFHPIEAGARAVAVPIEAKRHWNAELWTAVEDQLIPYCRTAGSNGHGIYLVFWFGGDHQTPAHPDGEPKPESATSLNVALEARLKPDHRDAIKVIVVDVSEPQQA